MGQSRAALGEARLAQGHVAEALSIAREVGASHGRNLRTVWLPATLVEAKALLAAGERAEARALLAKARGEILAIAARIGDEGLRASFLARGLWTAKLPAGRGRGREK
jgi:hypothetical protein